MQESVPKDALLMVNGLIFFRLSSDVGKAGGLCSHSSVTLFV